MKYLLLSMFLILTASAKTNIEGIISGCAFGASHQNLQTDKIKIRNSCKKCITEAPLMNHDKTEKFINKSADQCVIKYFENRK